MLPPKIKMAEKITKKMAQKILLAAVDAAASFCEEGERGSLWQVYDRAYQTCGLKEEDFLPSFIKESYWFRRLGRTLSPICILAVQNFLEAENSVPEDFSPCSYCPYADKRIEARGDYACRPGFVLTRRFTRLNQTSLEELDDALDCVIHSDDVAARIARDIIEELFKEELSPEGSWNRSQLISG